MKAKEAPKISLDSKKGLGGVDSVATMLGITLDLIQTLPLS